MSQLLNHLFLFACTKIAKDEKDGDLRRLLRHVTMRAKFTRRQRSKSAHGHLQSVHNEQTIDDAVATAAVEKLKLSNDELHTTLSSPDLEKRRGFLSKLRGEQKDVNKDGILLSNTQTEQHTEHIRRSPTLQNNVVSPSLDRGRPRNARPLVIMQSSHKIAPSPLATAMRSYCGTVPRPESVVLFPGHSRDILLKQSRDRVTSTSSNSSGLHLSSTARPNKNDVDGSTTKSAAAYLGSNADGHSPVMRRVVMRNRAANKLRCWHRPESNLTAEQARLFDLTGLENHPSSSLFPDETGDLESGGQESSTDVSPSHASAMNPEPSLEFEKVDYSYDMSPLSLTVQCGSDSDDFEGARETVVIPTHRLTSKHVWNVKTCSWEDVNRQSGTDAAHNYPETPDSCDVSHIAFRSVSRDAGNVVFTKPDTNVKSGMPVCSDEELRLAKSHRNRCFFSENDVHNAEHCLSEHDNILAVRHLAVQTLKHIDVGVSNKCDTRVRTRHSVIGGCCNEKVVSSLHRQITQSFCRAKSCPEVTAFSNILPLHCVHTRSVRRRRKTSRYVGDGRQTVPKGSERRKRSNRVIHRRQLALPLFASWPGKGDVKGSMLAYESSV